jgi:uncharacterized protein (TIGR01777 family)
MNIGLTGASGFIGRHLTGRLQAEGHSIRPISLRKPPRPQDLVGCEAVIHLAGETVAQRWTNSAKRRILESRETGTRSLVEAMWQQPPRMLVSASGIGYYGSRGDNLLTEHASAGNDFLAGVCVAWEREARKAEKLGVCVVPLRIGMVLGPGGGALARMLLPFRLGVGGRIGSGRQWMAWIHIEDLCSLIQFVLRENGVTSVLNATSPNPVRNSEFTRALAEALGKPAVFPVPVLGLRMLFGEMSEVLLASQRAVPEAALHAGFAFKYEHIDAALRSVLVA